MKRAILICSLVFTTSHLFAVGVISHWLFPNPKNPEGETTQERTRPIIVGDILYSANLSGMVAAVHRTEGYPFWQKKMAAGVEGALGYGRSKIVVGDLKGNLTVLNARDGSESWKYKIQSEWLSQPAFLREKLFVSSANDELYAFHEATGKELWHFSHRGDEKMTVRGTASPVIYGGDVFQGFSDGSLVALNASNGNVLWTKRLRTKDRFYDVDATPYVDETHVIASTFDGKLYCLDRLTGNTQWIHAVGSYGGFLVEDEKIYFAGLDGNFYALEKKTGQPIWKTSFKGGVGLTAARAGDFFVLTTSADLIHVFDPRDGKIVHTTLLASGTLASPSATEDGWFYVLTNYGHLFSYQVLKDLVLKKAPETVPSPSAVERNLTQQIKNSERS